MDFQRLEGKCDLNLKRFEAARIRLTELLEAEIREGHPRWATVDSLQNVLGKRGDYEERREFLRQFVDSQPGADGIPAYFILAGLLEDEVDMIDKIILFISRY